MSRRAAQLVAAAVLAGAPSALSADAAPVAPPAAREPSRLQVVADEFSLTLSRGTVRAGPAIVQLVDLGEDDHDLALRRAAPGATTRRIPRTSPGAVRELATRLRPGRYVLWCTLGDHRRRGMQAVLVARA